jgi:hypothetical protein
MSNKKNVTISLLDRRREYTGRLLGLIDDKEFHALVTKKRVANKIFSGQTIRLSDVVNNYKEGLKGMRLVLAVREIDGVAAGGKHLFVTEKLDYITFEETDKAGILGEDNEYYDITEGV